MTIETKYNIGDEVWGMPNGEPVKITIARMYIKIHKHKLSISYEFDDIDASRTMCEDILLHINQ